MQKPKEPPAYPISSVDNALRLILLFRSERRLRLTDAAAALQVAPSTAHRLLAMLAYHGFVLQDPVTKTYEAGPALLEVGLSVVRQLDIRAAARPTLEALARDCGETVHLAALEGSSVRYLDAVESTRALRVAIRTGMTLPAHCSSVGKALLAQLPLEQLRSRYPDATLVGQTARSLTSRAALERELEEVRARGYAVNAEESEDGVTAVAAAVLDASSSVPAALSVAAPTSRVAAGQIVALGQAVAARAAELGRVLSQRS